LTLEEIRANKPELASIMGPLQQQLQTAGNR